ncbi:exonuclease VII small subunit [Candidatus Pelagibacter sp.]|nr:exonuclease VII small subunit [Candidatus Pelagibacter sp.]|tara:strand:+ start:33 stop:296 length:264 start_codon:yes stop_codon:yes gene_type:complete
MKDKNILADIENKSLEELNNMANKLIDNLEKKSIEEFTKDYQELIKLNNFIEKKFQEETRSISKQTKDKIEQIINNGKKIKNIIQKS